MEPICAAVSDATPAVLIEPICVLVSALTIFVDSAATSAVLRHDSVEVEIPDACTVVKAPSCPVLRLEITEPTWVLVSQLTCVALSALNARATSWEVDSEEMSLVETAATCAVPKLPNCAVLIPATCVEAIEPICAAVRDAKPAVLIEPICVLLRALTILVDSAATSAVLSPDSVEVERAEACTVVRAPSCPVLRLEITEPTCVLVSELTCAAFNALTARAPSWVVDSEEMSLVETAATCAVPKPDN